MIEQRQEELDESHLSFAGEIRSRESAMEQLSEGLREMRARCLKKEQEVEFHIGINFTSSWSLSSGG